MVKIRNLTSDDINFRLMFMDPSARDYYTSHFTNLISYEPKGCFVAIENDTPIGMVTTTTYKGHGWIGWLFVIPDRRGSGTGTALMEKAITHLEGIGIRSIQLEAVEKAIPLYEKLGFRPYGKTLRYSKEPSHARLDPLPMGYSILPYRPAALRALSSLDLQVFGYDREFIFTRVLADDFHEGHLVFANSRPIGYGIIRRIGPANVLGPMAAGNEDGWRALLLNAVARAQGRTSIIRVPDSNTMAKGLIERLGFKREEEWTMSMKRGKDVQVGRPQLVLGIGCPGKG